MRYWLLLVVIDLLLACCIPILMVMREDVAQW